MRCRSVIFGLGSLADEVLSWFRLVGVLLAVLVPITAMMMGFLVWAGKL
jgi:hypothetical protein